MTPSATPKAMRPNAALPDAVLPAHVPVLVVGGGPVGLTLAALLARHGTPALVLEADAGYCDGSRAICISRRSQEIMGWAGADAALTAKALPWTGGRSYFRDTEVLQFAMPSGEGDRFAPMVNVQQFYVEQYAHEAGLRSPGFDVRWSHRAVAVRDGQAGAEVDVALPNGTVRTLRCDWLVACDGGRSTVREQLGLAFEGMQYEGRYVIVDIEQKTQRATERLAWFDPPSNPGSTILMHRQPDDIWRIDYQIADDADAADAVKPENVLPRVQSHLEMIGETAPWTPLWISIYNAKCLTLPSYRHGRVLFAGDAAHLVPIFGVRGLNSGLDDAGNLAWKLALVQQGLAGDALLDSYSQERVGATRENIAYGAKSTEFMAPPHHGFALMREAALRLATMDPAVRSLINPRQSAPVEYRGSPLNLDGAGRGRDDRGDSDDRDHSGDSSGNGRQVAGGALRAGMPAPDALLDGIDGPLHLSTCFGGSFVALWFSDCDAASDAVIDSGPGVRASRCWHIARTGRAGPRRLIDRDGQAWARHGATEGDVWLVRPDGYLAGRWSLPAGRWGAADSGRIAATLLLALGVA